MGMMLNTKGRNDMSQKSNATQDSKRKGTGNCENPTFSKSTRID